MHDSILLIRFLNYYHLLSEEENREVLHSDFIKVIKDKYAEMHFQVE